MSKLDLTSYSSKKIYNAMLDLDLGTLFEVMMALNKTIENAQKRADNMAADKTKQDFGKFMQEASEDQQ